MDCQKKSEQMSERVNDFALGELSPKSELELLAHVGGCEACREAYDYAKAVRTVVDESVEALVAGEPSAQFMTRLRARLAKEPAPSGWNWDVWKFFENQSGERFSYLAGAFVVATILIVAIVGSPRRHVAAPSSLEGLETSFAPPIAAKPANEISNISMNPERPRKPSSARLVSSPNSQPEVLVSKGQLLAVAEFYEVTRSSRVNAGQIYAAQEEPQKPLEVKPIEITPLEPLDASVADTDSGSSLR
jgi:Putative zinc-finger